MFELLITSTDSPRILVVGCHADDIEIGCGGTLLSLLDRYPGAEVTWLVLSGKGDRQAEARASAAEFLQGSVASVRVEGFRDGFFPYHGAEVKEVFESLKSEVDPTLIFTHTEHDRHQDHRLVCELTWNTFRRHTILEYEIPKYDGDLGAPNVLVPISDDIAHHKAKLVSRHFATQAGKHWFDEEVFLGLMRLRGVESASRYAEGFYSRKLVVQI
jgi:LmbE family N-acetylglucosaminyl deacetylase